MNWLPRAVPRIATAARLTAAAALVLLGCSEHSPTAQLQELTSAIAELVVSAPVMQSSPVSPSSGVAHDYSAAATPSGSSLVYVSLPPGSIPNGENAIVRNLATGQMLTVQMIAGGFDPVSLTATVGDTVELQAYSHGIVVAVEFARVNLRRPPTLVRTDPPKGKTDVPLNTQIVIVFSEPVAPATIARGVNLLEGSMVVPGTVTLSESGITATFAPDSALAPQTSYEVVVDTSVRSLRGDALDSATHVSFTTGSGDALAGPAHDFGFSVGGSLSASQGSVGSPLSITVAKQNSFSGVVSVSISGLPGGVTTSPASPFTVVAGTTQAVTFAVPAVTPAGKSTFTLSGTGGTLATTASMSLTFAVTPTTPVVRTYQQGTVLYIETDVGNESSRIGVDQAYGGSIVEASWNGTNFVNHYSTGREIEAALYDGNTENDNCGGCTGWKPTQSGDQYAHGSPVLDQVRTATSIYTKTQPYHQYPDNKGGSSAQPVLSDIFVEQTVSPVPNHSRAFEVHYKITHFGSDAHANAVQEFPTLYANVGFDHFVNYSGTAPWTNAPVTTTNFPIRPPWPIFYESEKWGAFVNGEGIGVSMYVPVQYPYGTGMAFPGLSGETGRGTNYYRPYTFFSFGPGAILEGSVYLIVGSYADARVAIYDLQNSQSPADVFPPYGFVDAPTPNSGLFGTATVTGWVFDNVAVSKVEVFVDGVLAGTADYGRARPDVAAAWPNAPTNCGYQFSLNTLAYANGQHIIEVRATDTSGNIAVLPDVVVRIFN